MATRQYIGARYVPKFYDYNGSTNWQPGVEYESLTIVTRNGNSYTSKKPVPSNIGEPENNPEYWVATGLYNSQIEQYRSEVEEYKRELEPLLEEGGIKTENIADGSVTFEKLNETVAEVIFMPVAYNESLTEAAGDCSVIRSLRSDKTIMIDSGTARSYSVIVSELNKYNIKHIDYFILTHFHADHYENIQNFVSIGLINNDTIAYLPRYDGADPVSQYFNPNNIITPNNTTVLELDAIHVTFFNCSSDDYAYYDSIGLTDLNNRSVCNYITIEGTTFLFTGDIHHQAQNYLCESGKIRHCNILKVPHHGYDNENSDNFFLECSPDYGVVSSNVYTYQLSGRPASSDSLAGVASGGGKTFTCGKGSVVCGVRTNDYTIISNGSEIREYAPRTFNVFVDQNYTGTVCDGSRYKPFKTLKAAVAFACKANVLKIGIIPVSAYTSDEAIVIQSCRAELIIDGFNVKSIEARNCTLSVANTTLTNTNACFVGESSFIYLSNVTCVTQSEAGANGRALLFYKTLVEMSNCTISNRSYAICGYWGSCIDVVNCGGVNNEIVFIANGCHIHTHTLNFPNQTMLGNDKDFVSGSINSYERIIVTYDGSDIEQTIDLSDNNKYSRRLLLLSVQGGGLYMITRWGGSCVLDTIHETQYAITVSVTGLSLNISAPTLPNIVFSLQYLN